MKEQILELLRENGDFVSGQEISERFGVSRTSVWKAIRGLESMGYVIEAVRNRGYRLCGEPDLLNAELIYEHLQTAWAGRPVIVYESLDSTNDEAKRRADGGAGEGLLVAAQEQTAGKGRRGRTWASERGKGIFMSLLLRPDIGPASAPMLTLVMGLAVCDALGEICGENNVRIKWPNDIVADGKKLCGILTEMSAEIDEIHYIVIGIGINVHNTEFPENVAETATSLRIQTGSDICRASLVAACMYRFEKYYEIFLRTRDMRGLINLYNDRLINQGREVRVLDPGGEYIGRSTGINDRGELLVVTDRGERRVSSGEVSVRGVYGYT